MRGAIAGVVVFHGVVPKVRSRHNWLHQVNDASGKKPGFSFVNQHLVDEHRVSSLRVDPQRKNRVSAPEIALSS